MPWTRASCRTEKKELPTVKLSRQRVVFLKSFSIFRKINEVSIASVPATCDGIVAYPISWFLRDNKHLVIHGLHSLCYLS